MLISGCFDYFEYIFIYSLNIDLNISFFLCLISLILSMFVILGFYWLKCLELFDIEVGNSGL